MLDFEWDISAVWEEFEGACRSQITGTAMFLNATAKTSSWDVGQRPRMSCTDKERSSENLPNQALERLGSNGTPSVAWERRLSELADYRKIHGHCNVLKLQRKQSWQVGQRRRNTSCTKKKAAMTTLRISHWNGFRMGRTAPGSPFGSLPTIAKSTGTVFLPLQRKHPAG
jgi:hypothetical protein